MRWAWVLAVGLAVLGCTDPKLVPMLGNWTGGFKIDTVDGKPNPEEARKLAFKSYLQLYRTRDKFKLRMENPRQSFEITGTWQRKTKQIELIPGEFTFDNPSEDDQKSRGIKIVQPDEVRAVYGKAFFLDISEDEKQLVSPLMSLGELAGHHFFSKAATSAFAEREYERMRKQK
jgi:hypothetical protein